MIKKITLIKNIEKNILSRENEKNWLAYNNDGYVNITLLTD